MYIVGLVYRKGRQYYLAVDRDTLITVEHGRVVELRPGVKFTIAREVSVGTLCWRWGVGSEILDHISERWMAPSEAGRLKASLQRSAYLAEWARKWEGRPSQQRGLLERGAGSRRRRERSGNVRRGRIRRQGQHRAN